ncbi:hypothetical protein B4U80_07724 [Leptotrombidium deliense]|uniref:Uncharacterized protein n=1 Tax=Leptotrombidium deliense TaxID=299467 RepID=A0A443RYT7_9ACAR|nr:hypothetical protein B4U80_07724 [Leptotrombidium deliense]
MKTKLDKQSTK